MTVQCHSDRNRRECTGEQLSRAMWSSFNKQGMSHLCDRTVAGPTAQRHNALDIKMRIPPLAVTPLLNRPDKCVSIWSAKSKGTAKTRTDIFCFFGSMARKTSEKAQILYLGEGRAWAIVVGRGPYKTFFLLNSGSFYIENKGNSLLNFAENAPKHCGPSFFPSTNSYRARKSLRSMENEKRKEPHSNWRRPEYG